MEVFNVNKCSDSGIDLKNDKELESLLEKIKDSEEIMIKWIEPETDETYEQKKSEILLTDNLMSRIKDGRFRLTSTKPKEDE